MYDSHIDTCTERYRHAYDVELRTAIHSGAPTGRVEIRIHANTRTQAAHKARALVGGVVASVNMVG
jgi:hypothetical protein